MLLRQLRLGTASGGGRGGGEGVGGGTVERFSIDPTVMVLVNLAFYTLPFTCVAVELEIGEALKIL